MVDTSNSKFSVQSLPSLLRGVENFDRLRTLPRRAQLGPKESHPERIYLS
jgi:hypothetical protein